MRALALIALIACAPPPPKDDTYALELGSAPAAGQGFETMPVPATLQPGAQGGFHVWLSYRIKGEPRTLRAEHVVRRASDGKLLSRGERKLELGEAGEDGWWQSEQATPAFLCPSPLGVNIVDADAEFEVTLLDGETELMKQQVATKLVCPEGAQAEFCARICSG